MPKTKKQPAIERDNLPRATLTITDETIWLTRHDRTGAPGATYPVSAASVANAFNQFGASTGLLSADTLFWQSQGGQLRIGVWIAPGKHTLKLRAGRRLEVLAVPLPGFVFVGQGKEYRIFAAGQRPARESDSIYHCPLPNVYDDGRICPGDVPFPACSENTIGAAIALFFESEFNHDLAGQETIGLLKSLRRKRKFPIERLERCATIVSIMNGSGRDPEEIDWPIDDDEDGNVRFDEDVWGNEEDGDEPED